MTGEREGPPSPRALQLTRWHLDSELEEARDRLLEEGCEPDEVARLLTDIFSEVVAGWSR